MKFKASCSLLIILNSNLKWRNVVGADSGNGTFPVDFENVNDICMMLIGTNEVIYATEMIPSALKNNCEVVLRYNDLIGVVKFNGSSITVKDIANIKGISIWIR